MVFFDICRLKAEKALWFAETYGLIPKTLTMADSTGTEINVPIGRDQNSGYSTKGLVINWGGGVVVNFFHVHVMCHRLKMKVKMKV